MVESTKVTVTVNYATATTLLTAIAAAVSKALERPELYSRDRTANIMHTYIDFATALNMADIAVLEKATNWLVQYTAATPTAPAKETKATMDGLYFPKTIQLVLEKNVKLHLAGCKIHKSQAGFLSLVNPVYGEGYYGKFTREGKFTPTESCKQEFLDQLQDVEDNGIQAIKRISALTGRCCVCSRTLTNEDSIEAGIGPICAEKVGW